MYFLENFYLANIKYCLINKFIYFQTNKLPKFKTIVLNFDSKTSNNIKIIFSGLLAFELIAKQKGMLTTKSFGLAVKIKKGSLVGCKLILKKHRLLKMFSYFLFNIFPKLKQGSLCINQNSAFCKISETFTFFKLESYYYFFNNLPNINFTVVVTGENKKRNLFFFKLFYF